MDRNIDTSVLTFPDSHNGTITALTFLDTKLVSASYDKTVKVWDIDNQKCEATLHGHSDSVASLACIQNELFSGSVNGELIAWNVEKKSSRIYIQ